MNSSWAWLLSILVIIVPVLMAGPLRDQVKSLLGNIGMGGIVRLWSRRLSERTSGFLHEPARWFRIRVGQLFILEPLKLKQITSTFEDVWTERPNNIEDASTGQLREVVKEASAAGHTIDNNLGFDLRRIDVERPQKQDVAARENFYRLHFRPSDFFSFVYPNLRIYNLEKLGAEDGKLLREAADLREVGLGFDTLDTRKARFRVGTNTVAITTDNQVVLSIRSRRQLIASGGNFGGASQTKFRLHTSAPEGMLRAKSIEDDDRWLGNVHPGATSIRALSHELGLRDGVHFQSAKLRCLGWYLDLLRCEPQFVFFVRLAVPASEVLACWDEGPKDAHENLSICCVPWSLDSMELIYSEKSFWSLQAMLPSKDADYLDFPNANAEWSSNHAKTSMLICCAHQFGSSRVARRLGPILSKVPQGRTN